MIARLAGMGLGVALGPAGGGGRCCWAVSRGQGMSVSPAALESIGGIDIASFFDMVKTISGEVCRAVREEG